ncbi:MAG: response regulator transcription factor, partial [Gammaproteobacteria bacterium]|nr:response regulator transcription factor [Gammaproteobacteria bacterium]
MNHPRLLLADDHRIFLDGLIKLLESEYEIVAAVEDGRSLVSTAQEMQPDAIVMDISMPGFSGIEALRQMRLSGIEAKVVVLTMHDDPEYATEAFEAGALGYVLKHSATSELLTAVRE